MSWAHVDAVWASSRTKGPARAILLTLAIRADPSGECFPSLDRIARDAGLSRRTVYRTLPEIEALGELRIEQHGQVATTARRGKQAVNRYRLMLQPRVTVSLRSENRPRDRQTTDLGTGRHESRDTVSPESSLNPQREPSEEKPHRLTGQQVDYEKAKIPKIGGYGDIHGCPDPILVAMAVTGERKKSGWGRWMKVLNEARRTLGRIEADHLFRECVAELWAEWRDGEVRNPGAMLNRKLAAVFPDTTATPARHEPAPPPSDVVTRDEVLAAVERIPRL